MIRAATEADYDAYSRLFPELRVDDSPASREHFMAELRPRMIVSTDGDAVVGYALSDQLADTGYVRNVVTDPWARGRGHGIALMEALRAAFLAAGATAWRLNVKPDNTAAIRLYTRCGMTEAYRASVLRVPASVALEPSPDLALAPLVAADDAALEARFGLPSGQLAHARARPSRRVVKLVHGGQVAGIGVFAPSIPGAFPFHLTEPALAATFLACLRRLCAPEAPFVQVVVEADPQLRDAVLALGACVHLETSHMHGTL